MCLDTHMKLALYKYAIIIIIIIINLINVDVNIILMLHLKTVERKTCLQGACDLVSVGLMSSL